MVRESHTSESCAAGVLFGLASEPATVASESSEFGLQRSFAPGLGLKLNFFWAFLGNSFHSLCQWAIVVMLARLGSPELVGRYALALALTAPAFMMANLNLSAVLASDASSRYLFSHYAGLRVVSSGFAILASNSVAAAAGYPGAVLVIVFCVSLAKFVEALEDIIQALFQRRERMDFVGRSMIASSVVSAIAVGLTLYLSGSLWLAVLSLVAARSLVLLSYHIPVARAMAAITPSFSAAPLVRLAWLAGPLGLVSGLSSLSQQLPRVFTECYCGERELGLFSAVAAFGQMYPNFTTALSRSALPRLSRLWGEGNLLGFRRLVLLLLGVGFALASAGVTVAVLFGKPLLRAVYGPEYTSVAGVLGVIMLAAGIVAAGTFLGTAVTAAQRFASQAVVHIVKLGLIAVFARLAVPSLGALGAAWALVVGASFSFVAFAYLAMRAAQPSTSDHSIPSRDEP